MAAEGGGLLVYTRCGISVLKIDRQLLFSQLCGFMVGDVTINLVYRPPLCGIRISG